MPVENRALGHRLTFVCALTVMFFLSATGHATPSFLDAFHKHNSVMLLIDPATGAIVDANPAAGRFYGYSLDELRKMFIQHINQLTAEQVAQERKLAQTEGRNFFIFRHKIADGNSRTVEVHSVPLNFDGRFLLYSIVRDISLERTLKEDLWHYQTRLEEMVDLQTQDIKAKSHLTIVILGAGSAALFVLVLFLIITLRKHKLAEAERFKLSQAVEQSSATVIITDTDGMIEYVNSAFEHTSGYTRQEAIGKTPRILRSEETPDAHYKDLWHTILAGKSWTGEFHNKRKDGSLYWEAATIAPVRNVSGQITNFLAVKDSITERKEAQEKLNEQFHFLETLINTIPSPIFYKDTEGRYLGCNAPFEAFVGLPKADIIGKTVYDISPRELADKYQKADDDLLNTGGVQVYEGPVLFADGVRHEVMFSKAVFLNTDGSKGGIVGSMQDITDRLDAENAMRAAMEEANKANLAKSEFLSTVSHELRTPLTSIKGALGLLCGGQLGDLPTRVVDMLNIADKNTDRLTNLVNDILDVERLLSGKMTVDLHPVELSELVKDAVRQNQGYAIEHNVRFVLDEEPGKVMVQADQQRLAQVIANLLSNAAKFSYEGADVKISVTHKNGVARVAIADFGAGIPERFHDRVFDRFAQADSSDSRKKAGTGLGLNISKSIIERHDGVIDFETQEGVGTTFFFELKMMAD